MKHTPLVTGIHEAKTRESDTPVAKIVPSAPTASRKPGLLRGKITIKPGFDDLPRGFSAVD